MSYIFVTLKRVVKLILHSDKIKASFDMTPVCKAEAVVRKPLKLTDDKLVFNSSWTVCFLNLLLRLQDLHIPV